MSDHGPAADAAPVAEILVVDDRLADMRLVTEILEREGFLVRSARDGVLALRSARAKPPDLVLLDIRLPGMDGLEVCRRMKADPLTAAIPVLFISALNDDRDKGVAFQAGGVDYIAKPIRKDELLARVRTHLEIVRGREALARERDRVRQYLDIASVMIIALDTAGRMTLVNRRGCEVLGATETEILGRDWVENFIPPGERSRIRGVSARNLAGTLEFDEYVENPVLTMSGEQRLIAWHNAQLRDTSGTVTGTLSSGEDVTDLRRAEAERGRNAELLAVTLRSIGDAVIATDEQGRVSFMNPMAEELTGWAWKESTGRPLGDVFQIRNEETNFPVECPVERVFREGRVVGLANHTKLVRRDGTELPIADSGAPLRNDAGEIIGVVLVFRDYTERKRQQAQAMQTDRLASLGLLTAGVAHEINNPLSSVLYNIESLSHDLPALFKALHMDFSAVVDRCGLGEEWARGPDLERLCPAALEDILARLRDTLEGIWRIRDVTRGLGTFSRVEADRLVPVDLAQAIELAISMAFNEIKYRARLVKEYNRTAPVMGSDGRLSQVFLNLLLNAVHAIREGNVEGNEIRVRTWQDGDEVLAEVRDSGSGISAEHLPHVFEPFFTTRETRTGTGLGLPITRNIIESYGGRIEVTGVPGGGTSFVVRLPAMQPGEASTAAGPPAVEPTGPAPRGRILVVDDEPAVRKILRRMLGREHEVVTATSGDEGKRMLGEDTAFDLILCDVTMSGVSGTDLHRWLAETHPALSRHLVFITGGAFTPRAIKYLRQVDNLRIQKPFDTVDLLGLVRELVGASQGRKREGCVRRCPETVEPDPV